MLDIATLIKATKGSGRPTGMHQPFAWGQTSREQRALYAEPPLMWFPCWSNFQLGLSMAIYQHLAGRLEDEI